MNWQRLSIFLKPHGQIYRLSRTYLLFELTPDGGDLWAGGTPEQQMAFQEAEEHRREELDMQVPGLLAMNENLDRQYGVVHDTAQTQEWERSNAVIEAIGQNGLQNRAIEWLFHQRPVIVKSAIHPAGPYTLRSLWGGRYDVAALITNAPYLLPDIPQLQNWLGAMMKTHAARRAAAVEEIGREFGLDVGTAAAVAEKPQSQGDEEPARAAKPGVKAGSGLGVLVRHMMDVEGVTDYHVLLNALHQLESDPEWASRLHRTELSTGRLQRLYSDGKTPHDSDCPYCNGLRRLPMILAQIAYRFRPRTDN